MADEEERSISMCMDRPLGADELAPGAFDVAENAAIPPTLAEAGVVLPPFKII